MITKNYLQFSKSLTLHTNTQHANVHVRRGKRNVLPNTLPLKREQKEANNGEKLTF